MIKRFCADFCFFERKTLEQYSVIVRSFSGVPTEEEFRKPLEAKTIKKSARMKMPDIEKRFVEDTDHESLNRKSKVKILCVQIN